MLLKAFLCMLPLTALSAAQTYPLPEPCTGPACINPKGKLDYQDFSVIKRQSDGKYFRFAKCNATGEGLSVATAPALSGPWKFSYSALGGPLKSPLAVNNRAGANLWAPEVHFINNLYYLYYGINTAPFNFDQCVATSPTMEFGSWTDHGSMNVPISKTGNTQATESYVRLDGNLIAAGADPSGIATDQTPYMVFGSYQWGIYGFKVASNLLTIAPGATVDEIILEQHNPGIYAGNRTEGPYQLAHNNYVYLFYSIGNCCAADNTAYDNSVYRVQVCRRARTAGPTGPYVDRNGKDCLHAAAGVNRVGTTILASRADGQVFAPGSVGFLQDQSEGGLVMYYQWWNITKAAQAAGLDGLRFGWNRVRFDAQDWPQLY